MPFFNLFSTVKNQFLDQKVREYWEQTIEQIRQNTTNSN